jgi:hypothetical protein
MIKKVRHAAGRLVSIIKQTAVPPPEFVRRFRFKRMGELVSKYICSAH